MILFALGVMFMFAAVIACVNWLYARRGPTGTETIVILVGCVVGWVLMVSGFIKMIVNAFHH